MSASVISASSTEELIAGFRAHKLTRTQVLAALVAAGATAGGAAVLVNAVSSSPTTPASHHVAPVAGSHAQVSATAAHQRHVALQAGR
jgi:hypothetical protein